MTAKQAVERALQVFKWQSKDNVEKVELTLSGWSVYFKDGDIFYAN